MAKKTAAENRRRAAAKKAVGEAAVALAEPVPVGRPRSYKPEFALLALKAGRLGSTNDALARFFDISLNTLNEWMVEHAEFNDAIKEGRSWADAHVADSLFRRATGYSHPAVKFMTVSDGQGAGSHIEKIDYIEHYPPDTVACIFWLKNRQPELWRDKQEHDLKTPDGATFEFTLKIGSKTPGDNAKLIDQ